MFKHYLTSKYSDEFDVDGLPDFSKWDYDTGGDGFGNGELQNYTYRDLDNASVSEGTLKITALLESLGENDYTSARLKSKYRGDWTYGKFEIRAKLPSGEGTWPAIWMLPTYSVYGGWPYSGEIDIMEHVGSDPTHVYSTIHTGAYNHSLDTQIGYNITGNTWESEFHVYGLEWSPGHMEAFVDGVSYGVYGFNPYVNPDIAVSDAWPFDIDFHLIMNLAIGGSWGGSVDDSIFPQTLEVDYVRVYQKDYAGMDQENPSDVTGLTLLANSYDSIKLVWTESTDDIAVKEYEIVVDDTLAGTSSLNAYNIVDLDPNTVYQVDVIAVDFAGNRSQATTLSISTQYLPTIPALIEAEDYDDKNGLIAKETCSDGEGAVCLTYLSVDDYMIYNLLVETAGTYTVTYRISSETDTGVIKLYGKGPFPIATTTIPVTGSYDNFVDVVSSTFTLSEGAYSFKVLVDMDGFYLNYLEFEKVD